jgi:hypothetical protein
MTRHRPRHQRHQWTTYEEQFLRDWYPHVMTATLADALGLAAKRVHSRAFQLGLRKSRDLVVEMALENARRPDHGGIATRFKPGMVPWNKGHSYVAGGRSAETRFEAGRQPHEARNYCPIGSLRITTNGVLERKVTDDQRIVPARRWVAVARLVWEATHGPVPAGHAVVFRPGMKTTEVERITPDALELVTRAELLARNSVHRYPPELARLVQLRGALNRRINDQIRKRGQS